MIFFQIARVLKLGERLALSDIALKKELPENAVTSLADRTTAHAISAGTLPGLRGHPELPKVLKKRGIDLSDAQPQKLTAELATDAELLVIMGCDEQYSLLPGLRRDDWPLSDLKVLPIEDVREIRDKVKRRLMAEWTADNSFSKSEMMKASIGNSTIQVVAVLAETVLTTLSSGIAPATMQGETNRCPRQAP